MNYSNNQLGDEEAKEPADNTIMFLQTKDYQIKHSTLPESESIS